MTDPTVNLLFVAVVIGLLPALIAHSKGHSFGKWWLFGAALFIVALPMAIMEKPSTEGKKKCPSCTSMVPSEAVVCPNCTREFPKAAAAGWYVITESPNFQRWWDGAGWTQKTRQTPKPKAARND